MVGVLSVVVALVGGTTAAGLARFARRAQAADRAAALVPRATRVPRWLVRRLDDALRAADIRCEPVAALQCWLLALVVATATAVLLAPAFGVLAVAAVAIGGPVGLHCARGRGRRRAAAAVPEALERCALELRGGGTIPTAVAALAERDAPLAPDFARVRDRCALGAPFEDAMARWADERDAPGVRAAAGALALGVSVGGACADALEALAASLRSRLAVMAEASALSAQARVSAIVVGAAPIGYLAWSTVVDPGPVQTLVGSFAGRACFALAIALEALAGVWMRRVLRDDAWS
jgi:tight adherence protein B